ncbi:MAG TPA: histidine kinase [Fervidobacterium sp.]|mgnify:FL=1|nr:histidine kinase [Fervidobacterium sp.]HUM76024.1 histidine kinase [Fervidobacterium sp.]
MIYLRFLLFLQLIAVVIFIFIMYFIPANLYLVSIISIFVIVNTVGITYYILRSWAANLKNEGTKSKVSFAFTLIGVIFAIAFLLINLSNFWLSKYSYDKFINFTNALALVTTLLLVSFGISYVALKRELEKQIGEYEKLKKIKLETEFQLLKSKVNPHFLFNSIGTAISMLEIGNDQKEIAQYLSSLAELFRTTIDAPDVWELQEEYDMIEKYLRVQKVRLDDKLSYELTLPNECKNLKVPSLLLQPIVENSIVHGISKSTKPCFIKVICERSDTYVILTVQDDGVGSDNLQNGTGLNLVEERLKLFSSGSHMDILSSAESGTVVRIFLKI